MAINSVGSQVQNPTELFKTNHDQSPPEQPENVSQENDQSFKIRISAEARDLQKQAVADAADERQVRAREIKEQQDKSNNRKDESEGTGSQEQGRSVDILA